MKNRVRFGVKVPIFTNAGVFVFYLNDVDAEKMNRHIEQIQLLLRLAGQDRIADRIVFQIGN